VSMYSAPDGFKSVSKGWDEMDVRLYGGLIGLGSLVLIGINLPFMLKVERIGHAVYYSAAAAILSLWLYMGLLFMLFFMTTALENDAGLAGFVAGIAASVLIWLVLGGQYLLQNQRQQAPAAT
jgi:hypothetical protein